jgi:hypothetical protein
MLSYPTQHAVRYTRRLDADPCKRTFKLSTEGAVSRCPRQHGCGVTVLFLLRLAKGEAEASRVLQRTGKKRGAGDHAC